MGRGTKKEIGVRLRSGFHVLNPSSFVLRLTFLVLCLCLFITGCATYNAATGRREFIFISTDAEVSMGQSFNAQLKGQYPVCQDRAKVERLQRIGARLAQVSDRQDFEYHFTLIAKDEMNAFTVPGGYIYF